MTQVGGQGFSNTYITGFDQNFPWLIFPLYGNYNDAPLVIHTLLKLMQACCGCASHASVPSKGDFSAPSDTELVEVIPMLLLLESFYGLHTTRICNSSLKPSLSVLEFVLQLWRSFSKAVRQNLERKAWVWGYCNSQYLPRLNNSYHFLHTTPTASNDSCGQCGEGGLGMRLPLDKAVTMYSQVQYCKYQGRLYIGYSHFKSCAFTKF